jgi:hypothetical protein
MPDETGAQFSEIGRAVKRQARLKRFDAPLSQMHCANAIWFGNEFLHRHRLGTGSFDTQKAA